MALQPNEVHLFFLFAELFTKDGKVTAGTHEAKAHSQASQECNRPQLHFKAIITSEKYVLVLFWRNVECHLSDLANVAQNGIRRLCSDRILDFNTDRIKKQ